MTNGRLSKLIKRYNAWYRLIRSWELLQYTVFFAVAGILLYALADKVFYLDLDVGFASMIVGMLALLYLLGAFVLQRRRTQYVGYLIDHHAGLKNLIASGLEVELQQDELSQLVVARAEGELKNHSPRSTIPGRFNWAGKYVLVLVAALFASVFFLPNFDVFGRRKDMLAKKEAKERQVETAELLNETVKELKQVDSKVESIDGKNIADDMMALAKNLENAPTRKEALSKLNSLENRYKEEFKQNRDFKKATQNLSSRLNASDLNQESKNYLKQLAKSMRKNDFKKSAEAMRKLAEQMQDPKLSDEEKRAMARELNKMVSQLQGQQQADKLAKTLQQMESSPTQQNNNSQNAKKDQNQQKKPAQKNQQNMAQNKPGQKQGQKNQQQGPKQQNKAQQNTMQKNQQDAADNKNQSNCPECKSNQCQKPGHKSGQKSGQSGSGQKLTQDQTGNAADQMNQMADTFKQMESLQKMEEGLNKARENMVGSEFKGFDQKDVDKYLPPGNGMAGQGQGKKKGKGGAFGGPGQGQGGQAPEQRTNTGEKEELAHGKTRKGKIINELWVYGIPEETEVQEEYSSAVRNAKEDAMSSLAKNRVPREYESMVKDYFTSIEGTEEKEE